MKIKNIKIKNFLGIEERGIEAGKINLIKGPEGSGKTSILEAIEKTFTNTDRRTEVVKHGENEALLLIETTTGLEVDRRIRTDKADYLKVRQENGSAPSTEKYLRSLLNGDIFRPVEWIKKGIKEQTKSILNMLQIGWTMEDITKWFGEEVPGINYEQHILQVLKAIETKYYNDREEVNRTIREYESQVDVIKKDLPPDFNGDEWKDKKIQDYYAKVSEAQSINNLIAEHKNIAKNYDDKISSIEAYEIKLKNEITLKYKAEREEIKDIIDLANNRIEKAQNTLESIDKNKDTALKNIDDLLEVRIEKAIQKLKAEAEEEKEALRKQIEFNKQEAIEIISLNKTKIATNEQKLLGIDKVEEQEYKNVEDRKETAIKAEKLKIGKAAEYLETHQEIDIEPLQRKADEVTEMHGYLRQWEMMIDIRDNQLADRERYSNLLTSRIKKARELPSELLKSAKMPIEGISVDGKGFIRINGTLIDGLSEGEQFRLAWKIAKEQAGALKVLCLDGFEKLNPATQEFVLKEMESDDYQYFVTSTNSDEFVIEKRG